MVRTLSQLKSGIGRLSQEFPHCQCQRQNRFRSRRCHRLSITICGDSYDIRRGRSTYPPPVIVKVMKVIHGDPGAWSGVIRAANLAYFYGCHGYLRVVPPVVTGTEPVRRFGIPGPGSHRRMGPFLLGCSAADPILCLFR